MILSFDRRGRSRAGCARPIPWYRLARPPLCPKCQVPCLVYRTSDARMQYRKCPKCGHTIKTVAGVPEADASSLPVHGSIA